MKKYNEIIDEINSIRVEKRKTEERLNQKIEEQFKKKTGKEERMRINKERMNYER